MFGPIGKGKSGPREQERLMAVLKDSCFHRLEEPEVNGDPHEELIPPVTALPLSHLSYCRLQHPALSSSVVSFVRRLNRSYQTSPAYG